jgi:23S rRNA G2445 N2-methylase RlmL
MKGLAITNTGIEDVAASEIRELTGARTSIFEGCVFFETEKFEDFFRLCYRAQSVSKILFLFAKFEIKKIDDIGNEIQKLNLDKWINSKTTFVVRSTINNPCFSSQELEPEVGGFIIEKTKAKVELSKPDTTFFVFVSKDGCFIGIDFSGEDLGKREYRIFKGADKIKPTVAFSLLKIADFSPEESLLDPFCKSGTIPIEAALFAAKFPVNHFSKDNFLFLRLKRFKDFDFEKFFENEDKKINAKIKTSITAADSSFQAIASAKKNANIAGIIKKISFSRKEPKWLDIKFKKGGVGKIVTFPPQKTRHTPAKKIEKAYDELFYQAEYILKEKGRAVLLMEGTKEIEKSAEKYKFKLREKRKVMQGKEEFDIIVFEK